MKVLIVGDSRRMKGGVSTVIKAMEADPIWGKYHCYWLQCQINRGIGWKLLYLAWGMMNALVRVPLYDVVHFHTTPGPGMRVVLPIYLYALLWREKLVVQLHMGNQMRKYREDKLFRWVMEKADRVIVLGETWKRFLEDEMGVSTKTDYLYNPVLWNETAQSAYETLTLRNGAGHLRNAALQNGRRPTKRPEAYETARGLRNAALQDSGSRDLGISGIREFGNSEILDKNYFLFAAFFNINKGYDVLLRAWAEVVQKYPEWRLVMCGAGDVADVKRYIAENGVESSVVLPGWVEGAEREAWFSGAAAYCMTSWQEGLPLSVLECMSMGVSVISTPVGCLPELLVDGENALLFPFGDSNALAVQMIRIIEDDALCARIARNAKLVAAEKFEAPKVFAKLSAIYEDVESTD